jgi:hypothetical protein
MCNPVAIGLMVAGTALQVNAQHQRNTAMQNAAGDARALESSRQDKLRNEREDVLLGSQKNLGVDAQTQLLTDAAAKREAAYAAAPDSAAPATYNTATDSGTPKIVMEDANAKRSKANAEVQQVGNARARLGSYGDVGVGNRLVSSDAANNLGILGGFARQSAALLPGEVQSAMTRKAGTGQNQEMLGTALQLYGAAGAPALFGGAAAAGAGATEAATAGAATAGAADAAAAYAPGAAGQALMGTTASSLFPTATATAARAAAPGMMGGLFSNSAPLFGTAATKGYLPGRSSWASLLRG